MFSSIVVGTDGSETAGKAVLQAIELARQVGASVSLVTAYEPVSEPAPARGEREVPEDMQWMVNPREDVDATLKEAAEQVEGAGVEGRHLRPRGRLRPTRSSTSPRRRTPT